MEEICGKSFSKQSVSEAYTELDVAIDAFCNRRLKDNYLFVVVDATYIKVQENHRIVSKALPVAIGLTDGGLKEIIGISLADAKTKESWTSFIRLLAARGRRNDGDGAFHLNTQGVYVPQTTLEDLTRR